jgi:DNA-directed RNA polymerase subunit alpha
VEVRESERIEVGVLAIDAIYTPVKSVFFDISNVRVGQMTNYDKLVLNIETDGSITGMEAIDIASNILVDHFKMLFNGAGAVLAAQTIEEEPAVDESEIAETLQDLEASGEEEVAQESDLDSITISNRAKNALLKAGITTVAQMKALKNEDIEGIPGLGKKTILEIMMLIGRQ